MTIETARLILQPYTPEQLLALIEAPERFEALAGFPAATGLREAFGSESVSSEWLATLRTLRAADPWQLGFAAVHRESRSIIGGAGFKGPPERDGIVEVAYAIMPAFEGRGYATEAAGAAVGWAFAGGLVQRVRAHTLPAANASTRVLTKCGFAYIGEVVDPDDGPVWRWERGAGA